MGTSSKNLKNIGKLKILKNVEIDDILLIEIRYRLRFLFTLVFSWNLISLIYIWSESEFSTQSKLWSTNYGDFFRTDLAYVVVQNNFGSPYEFHSEIPTLTGQIYWPLPFLFLRLVGAKYVDWNPNYLHVTFFAMASIFLCAGALYYSARSLKLFDRLVATIGLSVISVPAMFVYSTANLQGLITFFLLLGFVAFSRSNKIWKPVLIRFVSFVIVVGSKPQYFLMTFFLFLKRQSFLIKQFIFSLLGTLFLVGFGFAYFNSGFINNFSYWMNSVFNFSGKVDPPFAVHKNSSIIGNLLAIEMSITGGNQQSYIVLDLQFLIIIMILFVTLAIAFLLWKKVCPTWLLIWLLGGLSAVLIPVSYAYSFLIFLVPTCLMLLDIGNASKATLMLMKDKVNFSLISISYILIFCPKIIYIEFAPKISGTNLYSCISSLSHLLILVVAFRLLINFDSLKETELKQLEK